MNIRILSLIGFLTFAHTSVAQELTCKNTRTGEVWNYRIEYIAYEQQGDAFVEEEGTMTFDTDQVVQDFRFFLDVVKDTERFARKFTNPRIGITDVLGIESCKS